VSTHGERYGESETEKGREREGERERGGEREGEINIEAPTIPLLLLSQLSKEREGEIDGQKKGIERERVCVCVCVIVSVSVCACVCACVYVASSTPNSCITSQLPLARIKKIMKSDEDVRVRYSDPCAFLFMRASAHACVCVCVCAYESLFYVMILNCRQHFFPALR
jgi:hypothetical protein